MRRTRDVDDGERLQAEEVELDEARLLDVVLVVLGDETLAVRAEARDVIPERALADDDAGGVHAGVAREALELAAPASSSSLDRRVARRAAP